MSARPDLPDHHPQNVRLSEWSDGWLKLSVAGHTDPLYIVAQEHEKRINGWPVTRQQMIDLLIANNDIPAAGI